MKFESWKDVFGDQQSRLLKTKVYQTRVFRTPEEAVYHGVVLGSSNGAYDRSKIMKSDGSLKPFDYNEASVEDRQIVQQWLKNN